VDSEIGRGSTFSVTLRFDSVPEPASLAPVESRELQSNRADNGGAGSRVRLLLVEDNPVNQKLALAILRKKGCRVDIAHHGSEAIERLDTAQRPYDAVLMDVQMPILDGLETARLLRRDPRWRELRSSR